MQSTQLYLDTARLGRMSLRAQETYLDFSRLAGQEGASIQFERFLREGNQSLPAGLQHRFPNLACWKGIAPLKESLRELAGSVPSLPILMANRSANLMRFAARLLFQPCENVLITDLGWPPYHEILEAEGRRTGRNVTTAMLRSLLCEGLMTEDEVIEAVQQRFRQANCDGLFLTAVSHLGIRLPVERIVRTLEATRDLRFVVIDGAQDFCHVSADLRNEYCDLYLAGAHKWLGGLNPMGLGFYGRRNSRAIIETLLDHVIANGELDDPLLRFTGRLETATLVGDSETVNLAPLFSCQGAVAEMLERPSPLSGSFLQRQKNLATATSVAESAGWRSAGPAVPFRTGMLLLQAERAATRMKSSHDLREEFAGNGVALTAYEDGFVRLSMPPVEWQSGELDHLRTALGAVA